MDTTAGSQRDALERARQIHAENTVIDSLAPTFTCEMMLTPAMIDLARSLQSQGRPRSAIRTALAEQLIESVGKDPEVRQAYIDFWNRAGVTAASSTLYDSGPPEQAWSDTIAELARGNKLINGLGDFFLLAGSGSDIERAHREGRHAVLYNLQNAEPVGDQFSRVDTLYNLGVRVIQIAYNLRNRFADGCVERRDGGLSRFGQVLVEKLNERRVLIDLSHSSDRTSLDVVETSQAPVAFTHTSARSLSHHARGKTDEALRAVADHGGYVGILIVPFFLLATDDDPNRHGDDLPAGWATLDTVVDHIQYVLNLVGSDSVGVGTDWGKPYYNVLQWSKGMVAEKSSAFDWVAWRPQDRFDPNMQTKNLETWDLWPNLTAAMIRRGIPEETVVKVVGGNFLRVFREVCG